MDHVTGSFRDPKGQVVSSGGRIFRAMSERGAESFGKIETTGFFTQLVAQGLLLPFQEAKRDMAGCLDSKVARLLEHPLLSYVSHPYEWSFSALRDAALLHLHIQLTALDYGVTLSDASAYNIQFIGGAPIFIDHLSFQPYTDGEYWTGHRQFCEQFLNPLLLQSATGIRFNDWYRGSLEGITSADLSRILPIRTHLRSQVLLNVTLPAWLGRRSTANETTSRTVDRRKFPIEAYRRMLLGLQKLVRSLSLPEAQTAWKDYAVQNSYGSEETERKRRFVADFASAVQPTMLFDIGCNSGSYSLTALANGAQSAVGFEYDHGALELAYRSAKEQKAAFLPLYLDVANPSPSQGWMQSERLGFSERDSADAVIALAIIHHLCLGRNVPLHSVVQWLVQIAPRGVIEFVPKDDPMSQALLRLREDVFETYSSDNFLRAVENRATIIRREQITASGRYLLWFDKTRSNKEMK